MRLSHPHTSTAEPLDGYVSVRVKQHHDGWTAERQRTFLAALAESGQVSVAAETAGVTPQSAYRLHHNQQGRGLAQAWDNALSCSPRITTRTPRPTRPRRA